MKRNLLLVILIVALFSSCATLTTTSTTNKKMDIYGSGVMQMPVVVDLDVSQVKVSASVIVTNNSIDVARENAVAKIIQETNCDVVIEPTYKEETIGMVTTVTAYGYPAKYKNFRTIQEKDIALLNTGVVQKAEVSQPAITKKGNSKKGGVIVGIVGTIVLLLGVISSF